MKKIPYRIIKKRDHIFSGIYSELNVCNNINIVNSKVFGLIIFYFFMNILSTALFRMKEIFCSFPLKWMYLCDWNIHTKNGQFNKYSSGVGNFILKVTLITYSLFYFFLWIFSFHCQRAVYLISLFRGKNLFYWDKPICRLIHSTLIKSLLVKSSIEVQIENKIK